MAAAGRLRDRAFGEVRGRLPDEPGQAALGQADVDVLPLAGLELVHIGGQDGVGRRDARAHVVDRDPRLQGTPVGFAGHAHDAAQPLGHQIETAVARVGTGLAEPGDRAIDQAGVDLAERVVVDAQPGGHPHPVVLDHHVGPFGQLVDRVPGLRVLQVQDNAALVAVYLREAGGFALDVGSHLARIVAARRLLDLDHVRAKVGQHHGAIGAGHDLGKIEHFQTGQGSCSVTRHCMLPTKESSWRSFSDR